MVDICWVVTKCKKRKETDTYYSKFIECFTIPLLSTHYTFYTKVFVQLVYTNQQRMYNGNKSGTNVFCQTPQGS